MLQEGRCGLAIGPGDGEDAYIVRGMVEERVGQYSHRCPHGWDDDLRDRHSEFALDDKPTGTRRDRVRRMVVTIGRRTGDAEEQCAGCDASRVVCEIDNVDSNYWERQTPRLNGTEEVREQHYLTKSSAPTGRGARIGRLSTRKHRIRIARLSQWSR